MRSAAAASAPAATAAISKPALPPPISGTAVEDLPVGPEDSAERQRLQREMEQQQQIEEWMISQGVSFGGMEDAIRDKSYTLGVLLGFFVLSLNVLVIVEVQAK